MPKTESVCYKWRMWPERVKSEPVKATSSVNSQQQQRILHIPERAASLVVAASYACLVILFAWPLPLNLKDRVVLARGSDFYQHIWNLWWMRFSLLTLHQNPYFTQYLDFPTGQPLTYHSLDPLDGIISLPFQGPLGLVLTFNLLRLAHLLFAALATYALLRLLKLPRGAAWVGGVLFAFSPLVGSSFDLGQLDVLSVGWLPLYILCLMKALGNKALGIRPGAWTWIPAAGLVLVASGLSSWYFFFGEALFTLLYIVWEAVSAWLQRRYTKFEDASLTTATASATTTGDPPRISWLAGLIVRAGAVGVVALLALSPLLVAALSESLKGEDFAVTRFRTVVANSADLLSFFLPMSARLQSSAINPHGSNPALGWVPLTLSIVALVVAGNMRARQEGSAARRFRWRIPWLMPWRLALWVFVVLIFCVLALGPRLLVAGADTGLPMPYTLIDGLPLISGLRVPLRLTIFASLGIAVLAAYGVAAIGQAVRRPSYKIGLFVALSILALLELFGIPRTLLNPEVDPFFTSIRTDGADVGVAVLELPYDPNVPLAMFHQTVHQHPILGAYTSRHYPYPWIRAAPGVAHLTQFDTPTLRATDIVTPQMRDTALATLDYYDVRYVVVHPLSDEGIDKKIRLTLETIFEAHKIAPVMRDDTLTVYRVPPQPQTGPIVGVGDGWYLPQNSADQTRIWRTTSGDAFVLVTNPMTATMAAQLRLLAFSSDRPRRLSVLLDGKTVEQEVVQTGAAQTFALPINLAPGEHWLEMRSPDPPYYLPNDARPMSVSFEQVAIEPR